MDNASEQFRFLMLMFRTGAVVARKLGGQGLGYGDLAILYAISQKPEGKILLSDLAKQVGLTTSEALRLLQSTEKLGAVKKETSGRDTFISLTPTGKQLFKNAVNLTEMRCSNLIPKTQSKNLNLVNTFLDNLVQ